MSVVVDLVWRWELARTLGLKGQQRGELGQEARYNEPGGLKHQH